MEQMMEHLLAEIKANHEELMAIMKACQEEIEAKMEAWLEEMKACQKATEACAEKAKAMIMAGQEEMRAKIKISLQEMKATESKANKESIKVVMEPYKWASRVKATHALAALKGWASDVLHRDPKRLKFEKRQWTWLEAATA
jgi:hypothetical protein